MSGQGKWSWGGGLALVLAGVLALLALPTVARAGQWMVVACVNPDGSAAPSDGWTSFTSGSVEVGSNNSTGCGPGQPMAAYMSADAPAPTGSAEVLEYQPPAGSTLEGGVLDVSLMADGGHPGYASGTAVLYEPSYQYDGSNVFYQCASGLAACSAQGDPNSYDGTLALPANRGGDLFVAAGCGGEPNSVCDQNASGGNWSSAQVAWAHLLLTNAAVPSGTGFSGSVLQNPVRGTGHLVFTAADTGGPGVLLVIASLDGHTVYAGAPNDNGGHCAPVGTDSASGALMFDWQQPCPATEAVDLAIPTAGLSDGPHELTVTVTDAARNTATVLDQTIVTSNPITTPVSGARRAIHARFVLDWSWRGLVTRLRAIHVHGLPRRAHIAVACRGRGCPRLRLRRAGGRSVHRLLRELTGRGFRAGDRLLITVSARGRSPERILLRIRAGRLPRARLLAP